MDYLAFALFGLGILLVLAGLLANQSEKQKEALYYMADKFKFFGKNPGKPPEQPAPSAPAPEQGYHSSHNPMQPAPQQAYPHQNTENFNHQSIYGGGNFPGIQIPHDRFQDAMQRNERYYDRAQQMPHEPPERPHTYGNRGQQYNSPVAAPEYNREHVTQYGNPRATNTGRAHASPAHEPVRAPSVHVDVEESNPLLFSKPAHLYLDNGSRNSYSGKDTSFNLEDISGIRRFGEGNFSYDGFHFYFEHDTGTEKFSLQDLDRISFYPNCVALSPKSDLPVALLFVDETRSLKQVVETFRVDYGA